MDKLEKEKMPRKGGRWWFSWRRRDFSADEVGGWNHRDEGWGTSGGRGCRGLTGYMLFLQRSAQREKTKAREQRG